MTHWYDDSANIAALLRWLDAEGDLPDGVDSAADVVEKPWKWTQEYEAMRREQGVRA